MTLVNRQTYTVTLPDGSQPGIISGTLTLDDSFVPYAQANIVIPTPQNTKQLDPRSVGATQPPRVVVGMFQEFMESASLGDLSALYPGSTLATLTAAFPTAALADVTAVYSTPWNDSNIWAERGPVYRQANLAIVEAETNDDGTTTLTLQSDETYALGAGGTQLATWGAAGNNSLAALVRAALTAIMPAKIKPTTDLDLTAAITASPSQPVFTDTVWDGLDTYVQLAGARLFCDENRVWHLIPNITPIAPTPVYSQGFESGVDSWSVGSQSTGWAHSGTHSLALASTSPTANLSSKRTLTGLTVGFQYTVTAWTANPNFASYSAYASIGVTGVGQSGWSAPLTAAASQVSYTFTATATSHEVFLNSKTTP